MTAPPRPLAGLALLALALLVGVGAALLLPTAWLFRPLAPEAEPAAVAGRPPDDHAAHGEGEAPLVGVVSVRRRQAQHRIPAYGKVQYDERTRAQVTAWVSGRLDDLYVDFTGTLVSKGDHVAEVYAPDLIVAQEELLSALRALDRIEDREGPGLESLRTTFASAVEGGRRKLVLLGMPREVVEEIARTRKVRDHLTIFSPVEGTVTAKHVNEGDYVVTGQAMFTVADLSNVWLVLEVFEEDVGAVFIGQSVDVEVPSLPGERFVGAVDFVAPHVDERLRVAQVRVNLPNPQGRLKPGAFANAEVVVELTSEGRPHDPVPPGAWYSPMHPHVVRDEPGQCPICGMDLVQKEGDPSQGTRPGPFLTVPRQAVLHGGTRKVVFVQVQAPGAGGEHGERPGVYEPREVETGFRVGEDLVVLDGLEEGDLVVVRGQFFLDSQLQLMGRPSLFTPGGGPQDAVADPHAGH